MGPNEAYHAIRDALMSKPSVSVLDCAYDDAKFGNFVIVFEADGEPRSVINDRGEIALCRGPAGNQHCTTVVPSVAAVEQEALITALGL